MQEKIKELLLWIFSEILPSSSSHNMTTTHQGRNHVFKVGGQIPWSRVLLSFYRKKIDRSTQFGAVGYIITLYS